MNGAVQAEESKPKKDASDRLPEVGEAVISKKHTFSLVHIVGTGGYGRVFRVTIKGSQRQVALKAELFSKAVLKNELVVLKSAFAHRCKHMCELIDYGRVGKQFKYLVMTLLGHDLYKLRRDRTSQAFTLGTSLRSAIQTLQAIEELHECGFVSRDIKPANFATGSPSENLVQRIFIFDFGLAKKYIKNGVVLPQRDSVGWRGTVRYGSLKAHSNQDLGRRDDIESWLYMIVEFSNGSLPWRFIHDRLEVGILKEAGRNDLRKQLFTKCPAQFAEFLTSVDALEFASTPPYGQFYAAMQQVLKDNSIAMDAPYDWELPDEVLSSSSCSESDKEGENTQLGGGNSDPPRGN